MAVDPVIPDDDKLADDELLTDEERAAMGDDDDQDDVSDGDDDDEEGEGQSGADDKAGGGDKKPDPQDAGRDDGKGDDEEDEPVATPAPLPLIKDDRKEGDAARLEAIATERDSLAEKFDEGELTAKEYNSQLRVLDKEERDLDWSMRKGALAEEVAGTQRLQSWNDDVAVFLAANPIISKNQTMMLSYDNVIRAVTADKANDKLTNTQKLQKAYDQWATDLGIKAAEAGTKTDPKPKDQPAAKKAEPAAKKAAPPVLKDLPAAEIEGTEDGRWAALDRLQTTDPIAYEKKVAALSDADFEAYTKAG